MSGRPQLTGDLAEFPPAPFRAFIGSEELTVRPGRIFYWQSPQVFHPVLGPLYWLGLDIAAITWPFPTWRVRYRPFDHERDA